MTVKEIAEEFKANVETIRLWIVGGKLPAVRAGRKWLVRRSEVLQFIGVDAPEAPAGQQFESTPPASPEPVRPPSSASRLIGDAPGLAGRAGG